MSNIILNAQQFKNIKHVLAILGDSNRKYYPSPFSPNTLVKMKGVKILGIFQLVLRKSSGFQEKGKRKEVRYSGSNL